MGMLCVACSEKDNRRVMIEAPIQSTTAVKYEARQCGLCTAAAAGSLVWRNAQSTIVVGRICLIPQR